MLKRIFDILVSGTALLVLSPILLVVIAILKVTGEREAFYFQERVGFLGKIIYVTKFVTMVKNAPNMGTQDITLKNDPRVLPIGKFLRKSKLNEVPQLWDVFVGTISLVGWRPLMPKGFADYPKWEEEGRDLRQCYREDIMPFKGELESWYVDHASLWTDLKIVLATAIAVLRPQWRGFWGWFGDLPKPTSPILKEVLRVDVG